MLAVSASSTPSCQVAGGDMRKVLNVFQTTSMGRFPSSSRKKAPPRLEWNAQGHGGRVDAGAVYASTGVPAPEVHVACACGVKGSGNQTAVFG